MSLRIPTHEDLKRLRKLAGLTQKELAKKAHVSQSLIARIEVGSVDPRASTLNRILSNISSTKQRRTSASFMHKTVITVNVRENIRKTVDLMEKHGISQLPVLDGDKVVGSVQEGTLIRSILRSRDREVLFASSLQSIMEDSFPIISPNTSIDEVLALFSTDKPAVLVVDKGRIVGIITKIDIITKIKP